MKNAQKLDSYTNTSAPSLHSCIFGKSAMMVGLIWTIWKTQGDTLKEIHICFVLFMKNAQKQYSDTLKMGVQL